MRSDVLKKTVPKRIVIGQQQRFMEKVPVGISRARLSFFNIVDKIIFERISSGISTIYRTHLGRCHSDRRVQPLILVLQYPRIEELPATIA